MYAIVKNSRKSGVEIAKVNTPIIKEDEVLIEVEAASICGTDVHIWNWNLWAQRHVLKIPIILGHEVAGKVIEIGKSVKQIQVGDKVSPEAHLFDGTCYQCKTRRMHICQNVQGLGVDRDGVFAQQFVVPERNVWKNNPHLDPAIASMQDPLGNAVHAILPQNCVERIVGKNVAVLGCGPIGLMAIAVLKHLSAGNIFAIAGGSNKIRMELANKMGADVVLSAEKDGETLVQQIKDATEGNGVDIALEMSGDPEAVRQTFEMLTPGGRVSLLGTLEKPLKLDLDQALIFKAAIVHGITGRRIFDTWYQMKGLLAKPAFREKISAIITHKLPMRDIDSGMELIKSKQAAKVALEPKW